MCMSCHYPWLNALGFALSKSSLWEYCDGFTRDDRGCSVHDIFDNKDVPLDAFQRYALENRFQYKILRSTKTRRKIKYLFEQCQWWAQALRIKGCDYFQLFHLDNDHIISLGSNNVSSYTS